MPSDATAGTNAKNGKHGKKKATKPRPRWARRGLGKFAYDWLVPLAVAFAVLTPLRSSLADWHDVPSGSMRPTILEGDRIWVNKLAFGLRVPFTHTWVATWDAPARGDIVTLASPANGTRLVKRIVGLPGDEIAMTGNRLTINGEALEYRVVDDAVLEPVPGAASGRGSGQATSVHALHVQETLGGVNHLLTIVPTAQSAHTFEAMTIPAGQYLVLGDNRDMSGDSRVFGLVEAAAIEGRVGGVAFSLDPDRMYWPRFERWGLGLK